MPHASRPHSGPDSGLELDFQDQEPSGGKETMIAGTADALEFDPMSQRGAPFSDFGGTEVDLSGPDLEDNAELDLDPNPAPVQPSPVARSAPAARQSLGHAATLIGGPGQPSPPGLAVGELDFDLEPADDAPALQAVAASPASALSSPRGSVPSLDVPSLSPQVAQPVAPQAASPRGLSGASEGGAIDGMASSGRGAFPGMSNEVDLGGDLDDLDFGGAAAAQLNVGIPMPEEGDDVPWPTGVTPTGHELAVSLKEAQELSGFGPAPEGFLNAPMYALRVFLALRELRDKDGSAQKRLMELESSRDEKLAAFAEEKRPELAGKDRFMSLFAEVDKNRESMAQKKLTLESADVEGAQALRDVQAQIDTCNADRLGKQQLRDERRMVLLQAQQTLGRHQVALKRIQIEWRNIEQRAAKTPGKEMPAELDQALDVLEATREKEKAALEYAKRQLKESKAFFEEAEDGVRVAVAELHRFEGQKEGLLMAYEGDIAVHSRALDAAKAELQAELANAGRVIIDLRGEVPVPAQVRRELLACDQAVAVAATHRETTRMALASMDHDAYGMGKAVWIGSFVAVVVLLLLAAL